MDTNQHCPPTLDQQKKRIQTAFYPVVGDHYHPVWRSTSTDASVRSRPGTPWPIAHYWRSISAVQLSRNYLSSLFIVFINELTDSLIVNNRDSEPGILCVCFYCLININNLLLPIIASDLAVVPPDSPATSIPRFPQRQVCI